MYKTFIKQFQLNNIINTSRITWPRPGDNL